MLKDIKSNKASILKTALLGGLKGGLRLAATSAVGIAIDMIIERFERRDTKKLEEKYNKCYIIKRGTKEKGEF